MTVLVLTFSVHSSMYRGTQGRNPTFKHTQETRSLAGSESSAQPQLHELPADQYPRMQPVKPLRPAQRRPAPQGQPQAPQRLQPQQRPLAPGQPGRSYGQPLPHPQFRSPLSPPVAPRPVAPSDGSRRMGVDLRHMQHLVSSLRALQQQNAQMAAHLSAVQVQYGLVCYENSRLKELRGKPLNAFPMSADGVFDQLLLRAFSVRGKTDDKATAGRCGVDEDRTAGGADSGADGGSADGVADGAAGDTAGDTAGTNLVRAAAPTLSICEPHESIAISPRELSFSTAAPGETQQRSLTLQNHSSGTALIRALRLFPSSATFIVSPAIPSAGLLLPPAATLELTVRAEALAEVGLHLCWILILVETARETARALEVSSAVLGVRACLYVSNPLDVKALSIEAIPFFPPEVRAIWSDPKTVRTPTPDAFSLFPPFERKMKIVHDNPAMLNDRRLNDELVDKLVGVSLTTKCRRKKEHEKGEDPNTVSVKLRARQEVTEALLAAAVSKSATVENVR